MNHAVTSTYGDSGLKLHAIYPATSDARLERITALEYCAMKNLLGFQQGAVADPRLGKNADRWNDGAIG